MQSCFCFFPLFACCNYASFYLGGFLHSFKANQIFSFRISRMIFGRRKNAAGSNPLMERPSPTTPFRSRFIFTFRSSTRCLFLLQLQIRQSTTVLKSLALVVHFSIGECNKQHVCRVRRPFHVISRQVWWPPPAAFFFRFECTLNLNTTMDALLLCSRNDSCNFSCKGRVNKL